VPEKRDAPMRAEPVRDVPKPEPVAEVTKPDAAAEAVEEAQVPVPAAATPLAEKPGCLSTLFPFLFKKK
jgi:hypothetical protein